MVQLCSIEQAVDDVLARLPAHIHMGMPLGLGKPNLFVNALYRRIAKLPERALTIYTALSLGRPPLGDGLQKRFLEPFIERVFGDYPELDFLAALRKDSLPSITHSNNSPHWRRWPSSSCNGCCNAWPSWRLTWLRQE